MQVGGFIADFLFIVGLVAAIGSVALAGGAYIYTRVAEGNAAVLKEEVEKQETDLRPQLLDQILGLDKKLSSIRQVLTGHLIPSNTFKLLEEHTLPQVRFSIFSYAAEQRRLELTGQAASYSVLAEQVRRLEALDEVEQVDFGGLSLGEKGLSNFKMNIIFSPSLLKYR